MLRNLANNALRERIISDPEHVRVILQQECDGIIEGVQAAAGVLRKGKASTYLGSVPLVVAQIWAKECGAPMGTREFAQYGKKKLMSGEYAKLQANLK